MSDPPANGDMGTPEDWEVPLVPSPRFAVRSARLSGPLWDACGCRALVGEAWPKLASPKGSDDCATAF